MNKTLLVLVGLFLSPLTLSAAIHTPYVVDEKPRVLFGNSAEIDGYYGLENYAADYRGGYLRVRFTYTHNGCCISTTSLYMYMTRSDPRTTASPEVVKLEPVLFFMGPFAHGGAESDRYNFSFQFTDSGYLVEISRSDGTLRYGFGRMVPGISTTDWVAFATIHPEEETSDIYSVAFTPKPITSKSVPVIVVPGIMSTELLEDKLIDSLVWPNFPLMALSVTDDFLNVLKMNGNGLPLSSNIITGNILTKLSDSDYWHGLLDELRVTQDLYEFPYDWRLDVESSAQKLQEKIDEVKIESGSEKVNLVAHSMGGLLVKKYLKDNGGDSVDKFIDIGTPHTGAPSAFRTLVFGENLGISYILGVFNLNSHKIKEISQNMPSVYELLPSREYFDNSDDDYKYYVFNAGSGEDRLNYEQTNAYLKTSGRNGLLVDRAKIFHQEIDNLNPEDFGVDAYNIVGCGVPTIGQFYILEEGDHPIYNIRMINGDGTVPLKSAKAMPASQTYYVKNAQHAIMPSASGVKELISGILTGTSTEFDISSFSNLNRSTEGCLIPDGKMVSFHSPMELHVYDELGNHTGPNSHGDTENEIDGVVYEVIGDNKFAFLPEGINYEILGIPTDSGTFDIRIQTITSGKVAALSYWDEVPVEPVSFILGKEVPTTILNVPVSAILDPEEANDITKPATEINIKGNGKSLDSYISSVHVILNSSDDNAGVLKTEYSLDGGRTLVRYNEPIHINDRGGVKLMYKSTDRAGNVELLKSKIINVIWPGNSGKKN